MADSATILIPDISGYTEFLTQTELVHSSHIVNELFEAILAANEGEFELSEVEGDALLLYRKGKPDRSRCARATVPEHVRKLPPAGQADRARRGMPVRRLPDGDEPEPEVHRPSRRRPGNQGAAIHEMRGGRHGRRAPPAEEPDRVERIHSRDVELPGFLELQRSGGRSGVGAFERRVPGDRDHSLSSTLRSPEFGEASRTRLRASAP